MRSLIVLLGSVLVVSALSAPAAEKEPFPFVYGAQYYRAPTPARVHWDRDLANMKAKGFNTVKYWVQWAWSERKPGEYTWDDLDELMRLAEKHDLKVVLNLILDVMPEWVERDYPDSLMELENGQKVHGRTPGHRQLGGYPGPCYNHEETTEARQEFARAAYEHFKEFPALLAWDVWNEPERTSEHRTGDRNQPQLCFCPSCQEKFREWCEEKYGSIEKLNERWGRCYTSFEAIRPPRDASCVNDFVDWRTFQMETLHREAAWRLNTLREIDPARHPHLHVVVACGIFSPSVAVDDFALARQCDLFGSSMVNEPYSCAEGVSAAQGRPFYNAEWHINFGSLNGYPRIVGRDAFFTEQLAQLGWGICGYLFWQYHAEALGREAPAWGLVNIDGSDRPVVKHAEEFVKAFSPLAKDFMTCRPRPAEVLVWRGARAEMYQWCRNWNVARYHAGLSAWCRALYALDVPFAITDTEMLEKGANPKARVLVLPQACFISRRDAEAFKAFVAAGGSVIAEGNLGHYDEDTGRYSDAVPGCGLAEAWGVKELQMTAARHLPVEEKADAASVDGTDDVAKAMQASGVSGSEFFRIKTPEGVTGYGAYDFIQLSTDQHTEVWGTWRGAAVAVRRWQPSNSYVVYVGTSLGAAAREKDDALLRHYLRKTLALSGYDVAEPTGLHRDILLDRAGQPKFVVFVNNAEAERTGVLPAGEWKPLLPDMTTKLRPKTAALFYRTDDAPAPIVGLWGMRLPYEGFFAGHLKVVKAPDGSLKGEILWRGASPVPVKITEKDGVYSFENGKNIRVEMRVTGDALACTLNGNRTFSGWRLPPIGPAPALDKAVYGEPIDLTSSMDNFRAAGAINGWTLKDGVLSNHVRYDDKGKRIGYFANLYTKRSDFFDFRLTCEVQVPKGCNSGIYLRGIYEIQIYDTYGKSVDCHNMGALYGRITPKVAAERKPGEWQTLDITLWKRHLTVILNGVKIIDNAPVEGVTGGALTADETVKGPIYLQGDHSDASFRKMIVTPILN